MWQTLANDYIKERETLWCRLQIWTGLEFVYIPWKQPRRLLFENGGKCDTGLKKVKVRQWEHFSSQCSPMTRKKNSIAFWRHPGFASLSRQDQYLKENELGELVERYRQAKSEVLEESLLSCRFGHHRSHVCGLLQIRFTSRYGATQCVWLRLGSSKIIVPQISNAGWPNLPKINDIPDDLTFCSIFWEPIVILNNLT